MCMNCGCGEINERHGNQANIVADDIRRAAEAGGQDMSTTVRNLQDSLRQVGDPQMSTSGSGSSSSGGTGGTRQR
jgi:hypothetical protein